MSDVPEIDYERNPIFRRPFEVGRCVERRRQALNLLEIARPDRGLDNQSTIEFLTDDEVDGLISAVSTFLRERTAEALRDLDAAADPQP